MKSLRPVLSIAVLVLLAGFARAEDKSVVAPAGETEVIPQDASAAVYDANNTFVGYELPSTVDLPDLRIINKNNYYSKFNSINGEINWISTLPLFLDAQCTVPYIQSYRNILIAYPNQPGSVFMLPQPSKGIYYIPLDAIRVDVKRGDAFFTIIDEKCSSKTGNKNDSITFYYQALPNDTAVTGFQDAYIGPLKVTR